MLELGEQYYWRKAGINSSRVETITIDPQDTNVHQHLVIESIVHLSSVEEI